MTSLTLTSTGTIRHSAGTPTAVERALLRLSAALEAAAVTRMQRRAATGSLASSHARRAAADRRRDVAATVHAGLLPH